MQQPPRTNEPVLSWERVGRWLIWEAISRAPITEGEAQQLQAKAGYMPMGYGFSQFRAHPIPNPHPGDTILYRARWQCYDSCD